MEVLIITLILYVIPISLAILLVSFIIQKIGYKDIAQKVKTISLIILIILFILTNAFNWISVRHQIEFEMHGKYEISILAIEQESFLDYPVDFKIEIIDKITKENYKVEISTSDGPFLDFYEVKNSEELIVIKGDKRNAPTKYLINVKEKDIDTYFEENEFDLINNIKINGNYQALIE